MAHINHKPPVYSDGCIPWLMKLSKAALADAVADLLRPQVHGRTVDDPVSEKDAREILAPVLRLRGDKDPADRRRKRKR